MQNQITLNSLELISQNKRINWYFYNRVKFDLQITQTVGRSYAIICLRTAIFSVRSLCNQKSLFVIIQFWFLISRMSIQLPHVQICRHRCNSSEIKCEKTSIPLNHLSNVNYSLTVCWPCALNLRNLVILRIYVALVILG